MTTDGEALHRQLLTLDAHLDIPAHFARDGWSFGKRHDPATDVSQVDLPRMEDGNLSGGFFVVYTAQGPLTPEGCGAGACLPAIGRDRRDDRALRRSHRARAHRGGCRTASCRKAADRLQEHRELLCDR